MMSQVPEPLRDPRPGRHGGGQQEEQGPGRAQQRDQALVPAVKSRVQGLT